MVSFDSFFVAAVIGTRLHISVAICCVVMAVYLIFLKWWNRTRLGSFELAQASAELGEVMPRPCGTTNGPCDPWRHLRSWTCFERGVCAAPFWWLWEITAPQNRWGHPESTPEFYCGDEKWVGPVVSLLFSTHAVFVLFIHIIIYPGGMAMSHLIVGPCKMNLVWVSSFKPRLPLSCFFSDWIKK